MWIGKERKRTDRGREGKGGQMKGKEVLWIKRKGEKRKILYIKGINGRAKVRQLKEN